MTRLLPFLLLTVLACSGAEEFPTFALTRTATATGVSIAFVPDRLPEEYVRLEWDFGDGTTSTEKAPTHVFDRNARYSVTLTVEGPDGVVTVPEYVSVEELPLPEPALLHAFLETPGIELHAANMLQLAPVEGTAALTPVHGVAYALRRGVDGALSADVGGVPSILFRPSGEERTVALAQVGGIHAATLDTTHAYSPAWFRDGELVAPSDDPMPRMKNNTPARLSLSPLLQNAKHRIGTDLRLELASEVDFATVDDVAYLLRGRHGTLSFTEESVTGTAARVIPAQELAKLGTGVVEVYATLRNKGSFIAGGEQVTAVNAVVTWGALLLTE